ncbi:unnamed protein product [Camellia sinensis]
MRNIGRMGIRYLHNLNAANVPNELIENGQKRVIEASLTLIRERAKLKGELVRALGGAVASASLLGIPLGHNSSFLQGPAFAPPRIREAIWCGSTNATTEEGKELNDPRVLTDVGDVPVQEIRDSGVDDDRLMNTISESVKLVMEQDPLRPLVLGGDHSISYPVVKAVSEKLGGPVDILHLDAHPDIYHCFEGNKYSHASSFARIMEGGYARRLLQVGIRSITSEGREQGKRFGVEQFEMRSFSKDRYFLENLKLGEGVKGVYISVDVDCLDPAFAPGVSHIEPGGLSFRDVLNILHNLQADVVAADVVEFNPQRDTVDGMTAMVAAKLWVHYIKVHYILGGVARNVAECMSKLRTKPYMISVVGLDMARGNLLLEHWKSARLSLDGDDIAHGEPMDGSQIDEDLNEPTMGEKLTSLNLLENDKVKSLEKKEIAQHAMPPD